MLIRLLDFEKFVGHDHGLIRASFVVATRHVEEAVLKGCSERVIVLPVRLAAHRTVVVAWLLLLLLLVSDCLLAAITGRLRLACLQVEAQIG